MRASCAPAARHADTISGRLESSSCPGCQPSSRMHSPGLQQAESSKRETTPESSGSERCSSVPARSPTRPPRRNSGAGTCQLGIGRPSAVHNPAYNARVEYGCGSATMYRFPLAPGSSSTCSASPHRSSTCTMDRRLPVSGNGGHQPDSTRHIILSRLPFTPGP